MELSLRTIAVPPRLDAGSVGALAAELGQALASADTRVLVLRGVAGTFCRGLDFAARPDPGALLPFAELLLALRGAPVPVVALVDGDALGGGLGLAAACDVVLASPRAQLGLPEALFGLVPGMVLPLVRERVGGAAARRIALRGAALTAAEAAAIGLVDELSPDLEDALRRHARLLARPAATAVRWLKAVPDALSAEVLHGAEQTAARLADPRVLAALAGFADGELPWEAQCPL